MYANTWNYDNTIAGAVYKHWLSVIDGGAVGGSGSDGHGGSDSGGDQRSGLRKI